MNPSPANNLLSDAIVLLNLFFSNGSMQSKGISQNNIPSLLFVLTIFGIFMFSSFVFAQSVPLNAFFWSGYNWHQTQANGITVSGANQPILTVQGTATNSYWNNEGRIFKRFNRTMAQVEIALADLPASASAAGIWLTKDNQNTLIVEKHRDITNPQYNTNIFIVERVNGSDFFVYVSPVLPSSNFDTYRIKKTPLGYEVYYNGALVYAGSLNLSGYNKIELVGVARAAGDQIQAQFRNYKER